MSVAQSGRAACSAEPGPMRPPAGKRSAAAKVIAVLVSFEHHDSPRGVSAVAAEVGISKPTVYRILRELVEQRLLVQLPDGQYEPALRLFELGTAVRRHMWLRNIALPLTPLGAPLASVFVPVMMAVPVPFLTRAMPPAPVFLIVPSHTTLPLPAPMMLLTVVPLELSMVPEPTSPLMVSVNPFNWSVPAAPTFSVPVPAPSGSAVALPSCNVPAETVVSPV